MIDSATFDRLLTPVSCGVSIYMPLDPTERDQRVPDARLRMLIGTAEARLERCTIESRGRNELLDSLRTFAGSVDFARHRTPGLAIFAAAATEGGDTIQVIPLPRSPDEIVVAGPTSTSSRCCR